MVAFNVIWWTLKPLEAAFFMCFVLLFYIDLLQLIEPREKRLSIWISTFQTGVKDMYLQQFLWNWPDGIDTSPYLG